MIEKTPEIVPAKPKSLKELQRDARLKAALKANMGRRKAQTRARAVQDDGVSDHGAPKDCKDSPDAGGNNENE